MANARKLPSGKWTVLAYGGKDEFGKQIRARFTSDSKKEAEYQAAAWVLEEKRKQKSQSLGSAMDAFISTCTLQGYSASTIPAYKSIRKNAFPTLVNRKVDDLKLSDIQRAVDLRTEDHSVKTVRNEFFFLREVLKMYAPALNLSGIKLAKRQKKKKASMSEAWASQIITYMRHEEPDMLIYTSLVIGAGLRPSESYALNWGDVSAAPITMLSGGNSLLMGCITINKARVRGVDGYVTKSTKTESGIRTLSVSWSLIETITSAKKRGADDERIIDLKPGLITRRWARCRSALGLPEDMRFYDLRHFFATAVAYSGASEEELAAVMGHSTSAFSHSVYVQIFEERQQAANAALAARNDALFGGSKQAK